MVTLPGLIVYLLCLDCSHGEAVERYMKLAKVELNKLESKVWVALNTLCSLSYTLAFYFILFLFFTEQFLCQQTL